MRVEVSRDPIACEVVINRKLIEARIFQDVKLPESINQTCKELWQNALLLILIDLIPAILELIAIMLHSSIIQFFPVAFVDPLQ